MPGLLAFVCVYVTVVAECIAGGAWTFISSASASPMRRACPSGLSCMCIGERLKTRHACHKPQPPVTGIIEARGKWMRRGKRQAEPSSTSSGRLPAHDLAAAGNVV